MRYGVIQAGQAREVFNGLPFQSCTLKIIDDDEAAAHSTEEVTLEPGQVIDYVASHPANALAAYDEDMRERFGILEITPADPPPTGQVTVSLELTVVGGQIVEVATYGPEETVPDEEVPMHKVLKAAILTPWPGFENLLEAIEDGISRLPSPQNMLAQAEWDRAPNLQRQGATTFAVMALIGMTEEKRDELLIKAMAMP